MANSNFVGSFLMFMVLAFLILSIAISQSFRNMINDSSDIICSTHFSYLGEFFQHSTLKCDTGYFKMSICVIKGCSLSPFY